MINKKLRIMKSRLKNVGIIYNSWKSNGNNIIEIKGVSCESVENIGVSKQSPLSTLNQQHAK